MTSKFALMSQLNLSPEKFAEHCEAKGLQVKSDYSESEVSKLKATARPTPKQQPDKTTPIAETTGSPTDRKVGKVSTQAATQTSDSVIDRANSLVAYADHLTLAVGQKVDEAAFQIAATIASVPAQLATRTQFYLDKMGGQDAWSQLDRALTAFTQPMPTKQQKVFHTAEFFELPECED